MEDRAVLGHVDFLPGEHGLDLLPEVGLPGKVEQQRLGPVGDTVLGIVEEDVAKPQREPLKALGVLGEQVTHVNAVHVLVMLCQGFPCGRTG